MTATYISSSTQLIIIHLILLDAANMAKGPDGSGDLGQDDAQHPKIEWQPPHEPTARIAPGLCDLERLLHGITGCLPSRC